MNEQEAYEFDRQGYIIIRDILDSDQIAALAKSIDLLEEHALLHVESPPRKKSAWGAEYHVSEEKGYHVQGERAEGKTLIIEDFWNSDSTFDFLVNHARTMNYINNIVKSRPTINNSEIRIRYRGNATGSHGGSRAANQKYKYSYGENGIDCMMVRIVYFVHDCNNEQGAFCVVPGTHKTNIPCPYGSNPDEEPGMIGLEVSAGDAILFTEHLRHGGFTNNSNQVRKTLHVGYGPHWLMSQNIATMDEPQHITENTFDRFDEAQRDLFLAWPPRD